MSTSQVETIVEDFADYAAANGLGTVNQTIFRGSLLPTPDAQIAFMLSGGLPADHSLDRTMEVDNPTVQVIVRGSPRDESGAMTTATRVCEVFDGIKGSKVGTNTYQAIKASAPPLLVAVDESRERPWVSINFELRIARV